MRFMIFLATAVTCAASAHAEEKSVEIPLKDIWALDMPGTRNIRELDDGNAQQALLEPFLERLQETWRNEHGWTVEGEGLAALQNFYRDETSPAKEKSAQTDPLLNPKQGRMFLSHKSPVSVVFFTRRTNQRVRLQRIEWTGKRLWIRYCATPSEPERTSQYFAIIPLGKLPIGSYYVTVERAPRKQDPPSSDARLPPHEDVCGDFSFEVVDKDAVTEAAKPRTIPLKDIWALEMPGTRDIRELDESEAQKAFLQPLLTHIRDTWDNDSGVAVQGEGLEALQHFNRIEVEGEKRDVLSADAPVSLVFYTKPIGLYVHLRSVEKKGNRVTIWYSLVPHQTRNESQHLALIPLGKIPAGKYVVRIERLPLEKKYRDMGYPEPSRKQASNICDTFQFMVIHRR